MSDLVLLLPENLSHPWDWSLPATDEQGRANDEKQKMDLSALSFSNLIAVIPGTNVITKKHLLGNLNKKQAKQAAGFSIEDDLATSLDDTHIVFDENTDRLAIISNDALTRIIFTLEEVGLSPDVISADYDCLDTASDYLYGGRIVKKSTDGLGFSIESGLARHILGDDVKSPAEITSSQFLSKITDARIAENAAINLRHGEFAKRSNIGFYGYKRSLWLACACAVTFIGLYLGHGLYIGGKTKGVTAEIRSIYAQLFPGESVPKNPVLKVLQAQAERKKVKGETFIRLSTILATSIKDLEGIEIVSIGYDKNRSQLSMSILYSGFEDVERLKATIAKQGGVFLESGTRQNDSGLVGDAVLKEAS